ncbi:MAG: hypothetical protein ACR2NF_09865, partial [Pirellulales bacterium]
LTPGYIVYEYDVADVQAWVDSIDFNVYLYEDPNSGKLTYAARGGVNEICQPLNPVDEAPFSELYLKTELADRTAREWLPCNNPPNQSVQLASCVNIDAGCGGLLVRPDLEAAGDDGAGLKFWSCNNLLNDEWISLRRFDGESYPFNTVNTPDKQIFQVPYDDRHYISVWGCDRIGQQIDERRAITGYMQIEFQFAGEESLGRCCFTEETEDGYNTCQDLTQQECEEKNGLWSAGITCDDLPCEIGEYSCFDAPPDNNEPDSEWVLQDDKCHKTEEECAEECGKCWQCYAQYLKPPVPDVGCGVSANGYEYKLPKSIRLKTFLTVGEIVQPGVNAQYDVADVQAWVDSLDFKVFLYEDPNSGKLTYRARGGTDAGCEDMPPAAGESAFYQSPFLVDLIGQDYPRCNSPGFNTGVRRSCVNIDASCDSLSVRPDVGPYGTANSGLYFYSCTSITGVDSVQWLRLDPEQFFPADTPDKQLFKVVYDNRHWITLNLCPPFNQELRAITGYLQIEFQFETEESLGRCCFTEETEDGYDTCQDLTKQECEEKNGLWSAGIACDDKPCEIVTHSCFEEPPDNNEPDSEWVLQDDKCHKIEEECAENCPPEETPPGGGRTMPTKTIGPGTHLKNMLKWFNIHAKEKGCKCAHMEKKMNQGPQWCRDHMQEILDHLAKEASRRKLPFIRLAAEKMVDLAIRKAEKDSA